MVKQARKRPQRADSSISVVQDQESATQEPDLSFQALLERADRTVERLSLSIGVNREMIDQEERDLAMQAEQASTDEEREAIQELALAIAAKREWIDKTEQALKELIDARQVLSTTLSQPP